MFEEAKYYRASSASVRIHRLASLVILLGLAWLQISGFIYGNVKLIAAQIVAVVVIWICEDYYHDKILRRCVPYRAVAWLFLIGVHPAIYLSKFVLKTILS